METMYFLILNLRLRHSEVTPGHYWTSHGKGGCPYKMQQQGAEEGVCLLQAADSQKEEWEVRIDWAAYAGPFAPKSHAEEGGRGWKRQRVSVSGPFFMSGEEPFHTGLLFLFKNFLHQKGSQIHIGFRRKSSGPWRAVIRVAQFSSAQVWCTVL